MTKINLGLMKRHGLPVNDFTLFKKIITLILGTKMGNL